MILESSTTRIVFCEYTSAGSILDDVGNGAAGAGVTGAGAAAGAGVVLVGTCSFDVTSDLGEIYFLTN